MFSEKNLWQPTASIENLKKRANILKKIRDFFYKRNIVEIETPSLSHATVTDVHLHSIRAQIALLNLQHTKTLYLQTSPEYAIKRLLAAGCGSVYQICKAFRDDESGRYHNPEFTLLEWYRIGFDHHALMGEMDEFFQAILNAKPAKKFSYQEVFEQYLNINPHTVSVEQLKQVAKQHNIGEVSGLEYEDRDTWLQIMMSHCIEPLLGQEEPVFIYDYPASQAALAKIRNANPSVGERFEVYIKGIEIANGFHELTDAKEQRKRFENDLKMREKLKLPKVPIDEHFLFALQHGMPECSGVALGVDRLVMIAVGAKHINEVIAFPIDRA